MKEVCLKFEITLPSFFIINFYRLSSFYLLWLNILLFRKDNKQIFHFFKNRMDHMKLLYSPLSFLILLSWFIFSIEESSTYAMVNSTNKLSDKLLDVLDHTDLNGAIVGLSVRNAKTGEVIFNFNGDSKLCF